MSRLALSLFILALDVARQNFKKYFNGRYRRAPILYS